MSYADIHRAYESGRGQWRGCQWSIIYGPQQLNLKGMNSRQARILANATAGLESKVWQEAASWLESVERDAQTAEAEAHRAVKLAAAGQLADAEKHAQRACQLEHSYRHTSVWTKLNQAIEQTIRESQSTDSPKPNATLAKNFAHSAKDLPT